MLSVHRHVDVVPCAVGRASDLQWPGHTGHGAPVQEDQRVRGERGIPRALAVQGQHGLLGAQGTQQGFRLGDRDRGNWRAAAVAVRGSVRSRRCAGVSDMAGC